MRSWTVHLPPGTSRASVPFTGAKAAPVLIREGFSLWAFLFGPLWLLANRCWLAGSAAALALGAFALLPDPYGFALSLSLQLLLGFHGRDLRRWTLARRGWTLAHIVLGHDADGALARLLQAEPRLLPLYASELRR